MALILKRIRTGFTCHLWLSVWNWKNNRTIP